VNHHNWGASPPDVAIEHLFPPYTEEKLKALSQWFAYKATKIPNKRAGEPWSA
jgi:hypothetical protein